MVRKTAMSAAVLAGAALALAACGDSGSKSAAAGSNPAMPPEDPARAAKVNGYDAAGKPIDAVTAAEMPEGQLPSLTGEGAGPPPKAEAPPPPKPAPAG